MNETKLVVFGRLRAAKFCGVLIAILLALSTSGCGLAPAGPLRTYLGVFGGEGDVGHAADIPYASIRLQRDGRGGLSVLAEQTGALTFWQSASRQTIVLNRGYLDHTAGLERNLLATRLSDGDGNALEAPWTQWNGATLKYLVMRRWQNEDGRIIAGQAEARLECESSLTSVELPLATIELRACRESLHWASGQRTSSRLWLAPNNRRIWMAIMEPWPGSAQFEWQVARPWW